MRRTKTTKRRLGIWVLLLLVGALIIVVARQFVSIENAPTDSKADLNRLRSLPYVNYTEEIVQDDQSGVVVHDREMAWPGYNLYCSRTKPEAFLIDMEGNTVHTWTYPRKTDEVWDHAIMLDQGELIVVRKFAELLKLDRDSNLIWRRRGPVHHDVAVASDGTLYVVGKLRREYRGLRVRFSTIMHLTHQGTLIDMFSTYDKLDDIKQAFDQKSFLDTQLDRPAVSKILDDLSNGVKSLLGKKKHKEKKKEIFAYFHANTVTPIQDTELGRRDERFAAGNLLTCFRNVNQIAVLAKDDWEILWVWGENMMEEPHHPTMTDDGTILVFDNGSRRKYSAVIELDPVTKEIVWEYTSEPREDFFSPTKGSAQRLPNGNTLICDGDSGRTFEVTRDGEIVWEWLNPRTKNGRRERVYRMMRLSSQRVAKALARPELSPPQ